MISPYIFSRGLNIKKTIPFDVENSRKNMINSAVDLLIYRHFPTLVQTRSGSKGQDNSFSAIVAPLVFECIIQLHSYNHIII